MTRAVKKPPLDNAEAADSPAPIAPRPCWKDEAVQISFGTGSASRLSDVAAALMPRVLARAAHDMEGMHRGEKAEQPGRAPERQIRTHPTDHTCTLCTPAAVSARPEA